MRAKIRYWAEFYPKVNCWDFNASCFQPNDRLDINLRVTRKAFENQCRDTFARHQPLRDKLFAAYAPTELPYQIDQMWLSLGGKRKQDINPTVLILGLSHPGCQYFREVERKLIERAKSELPMDQLISWQRLYQ